MVGAYSDTHNYFVGVFDQNHLRNLRYPFWGRGIAPRLVSITTIANRAPVVRSYQCYTIALAENYLKGFVQQKLLVADAPFVPHQS
jgi:hypothetical protein